MVNQVDKYELTRKFMQEIGIDPDKLADLIEKSENKTNVHCFAYQRYKKQTCSTCPFHPMPPVPHEHKRETS